MKKGFKMMPKLMPFFMIFHAFSKKAKSHETIVFTIENVVLGMQKRINNLSKIDAKSMLEKGMQKVWKTTGKWSPNASQNGWRI